MTSYAVPRSRRFENKFARLADVLLGFVRGFRLPVSAKNLASMPLTVAGIGCVAAGVFLWSLIAGLIFLGVALIVLEYLIADDR